MTQRVAARGEVSVVVPATSANLGPGFDALGLALGLYDEVTARVVDNPAVGGPELTIDVAGESALDVPRDANHLVVRAMHETFAALGAARPSLTLRCHNGIPHGRGLGSSAAAIVAGVLAARALVEGASETLDPAGVLDLAGRIEGHPDNVAGCLLGGLTVAWREEGGFRAVRLEPDPRLSACVFVPQESLATEHARGLLPAHVDHIDAAHTAGRAALLVAALTQRPELLLPATEDRLHQPYRAAAMPATDALVGRLRKLGLPAVVSGAGPTVLLPVVGDGPGELASLVGEAVEQGWVVRRLAIDVEGAQVTVST